MIVNLVSDEKALKNVVRTLDDVFASLPDTELLKETREFLGGVSNDLEQFNSVVEQLVRLRTIDARREEDDRKLVETLASHSARDTETYFEGNVIYSTDSQDECVDELSTSLLTSLPQDVQPTFFQGAFIPSKNHRALASVVVITTMTILGIVIATMLPFQNEPASNNYSGLFVEHWVGEPSTSINGGIDGSSEQMMIFMAKLCRSSVYGLEKLSKDACSDIWAQDNWATFYSPKTAQVVDHKPIQAADQKPTMPRWVVARIASLFRSNFGLRM
jgi:hypothetical protein